MLLTLTSFFISLIILPCLAYKYDRDSLVGWIIVPNVIVIIGCIVITYASYDNYVGMKQRLVNLNTYADTITSYEKFAKLDTIESGTTGSLTDLKYQNYQRSIKDLIQDLRNSCIIYNQTLVGKRTLGNNIVFNWLIIMPDDGMTVVRFSDFLDTKSRETI